MNFKDTMSRIYPTIYIDDALKLTILKKNDLRESLRVRNIKEIREMFFYSKVIKYAEHESWFRQYLLENNSIVYSIYMKNDYCGQISIYNYDGLTSEIGRIFLDTSYRKQGIMTKVYLKLEKIVSMDPLGIKKLKLQVKKSNRVAVAMYNKWDYSLVKDEYDRYIFEKEIQ